MTIRRAGLEDLDKLVPLFDGYRVFYKAESNPDGARLFLSARLERGESIVFVAEEGDRFLGFTQLYPYFSSVRMKRAWVLNDLFTATDARQRGVATALMNAARDFARETEAAWMLLQTAEDNVTAQRLYEAFGWKRESDYFYTLTI